MLDHLAQLHVLMKRGSATQFTKRDIVLVQFAHAIAALPTVLVLLKHFVHDRGWIATVLSRRRKWKSKIKHYR